jgi:hypothetical protein
LHATPLRYRHQHRGFCAALGHHLRALSYTGVKQFAEAGFGVLNWPCGKAHEDLQLTIYLTSLIEKLFFIYAEKPIQIGAFQTLNNIKKLYME